MKRDIMLKQRYIRLSLLLLTMVSNLLHADPLKIGDMLPDSLFYDQHEKPHKLNGQIQLLIFAHTKQMGALMTDILADAKPDLLQEHNAIYLADISGMPSLIARFIALPKMRKIDAPICLVREAKDAIWLPKMEDKLTLVKLAAGQVKAISYTSDEMAVRSLLGPPADSQKN
jgi:hypothetical protein